MIRSIYPSRELIGCLLAVPHAEDKRNVFKDGEGCISNIIGPLETREACRSLGQGTRRTHFALNTGGGTTATRGTQA